jgi:hypothetical protein
MFEKQSGSPVRIRTQPKGDAKAAENYERVKLERLANASERWANMPSVT